MAAVEIEIIGDGGFIPMVGSDGPRLVNRGAKVKVEKDPADQLIADGVAVKAGDTPASDPEPDSFDAATASDDELAAFVKDATITDIETLVGDDQDLAARVLAAEQARGEDARSTLVAKLEDVATA